MDSTIIVALISLVGSVIGTFSGIVASSKLTIYRIEQLEKRLDKYDDIEKRITAMERDNAVQESRIDRLEEE